MTAAPLRVGQTHSLTCALLLSLFFFFPLVKAGLSPGVHASAFSLCRGRFRMKEREEMWQKIEELARLNPQVGSSRTLGQTRQEYAGGVSASFLSSREQL